MKKSTYADYHVMVVKPVNGGRVTQKDQRALGERFTTFPKRDFYTIHFAVAHRDEVLALVRNAKLSKPMRVVEITEAQYARRFQLPEIIEGTGIHATERQLAESFIVGK